MPSRLFLLVVCLLLFCPAGHAVQVQFTPDMDGTLYEDLEGDVANGSGNYLFFGQVGDAGDRELRRALVRFDVSSIPQDARIQNVELQVEIDKVPQINPVGGIATIHRVLNSWGEGASNAPGGEGTGTIAQNNDATWQHRMYDSLSWDNPGGDFQSSVSSSVGYGVSVEILTFPDTATLRADVQSWVRNPSSNHGWMIRGNEDDPYAARRLYARESVGLGVPLLTVDYIIPSPTDNLGLTQVGSGLGQPVSIANASDGSERLFVVDRAGIIRIIDLATETVLGTPYLDLSGIVDTSGIEQGLLGLAFHPEFASNRQFYVNYTRDPAGVNNDRTVVAMYRQSLGNPNIAETTPTVILEFEQNSSNHNGGDLHFGADGYLYIATGDGGGVGDEYNNAQNVDTLKGKILRIDVDGSPQVGDETCGLVTNYGIPAGNAFPGGDDGCDEILHLGLRNPWRFSFDAQTEDMYIGDVGQFEWEEIDFAAAGASGRNFGWSCFEGNNVYDAGETCPNPVAPVLEYSSGSGTGNCSVTGGYVYRGSGTALFGYYVYGDYCSDRVWVARDNGGSWESQEWAGVDAVLGSIAAFGQDEFCELYIADSVAGLVYRIDDAERVSRSGFEALRCQ